MAYPLDIDAQNAVLDAMLGDNAAAGMPASFEVALFDENPALGGVEVPPDGGYARGSAANNTATFPGAVGGAKQVARIGFPDPSDEWAAVGRWWVFIDAADSTTRYMFGPLSEEIVIDGTETNIEIQPEITWNMEGL